MGDDQAMECILTFYLHIGITGYRLVPVRDPHVGDVQFAAQFAKGGPICRQRVLKRLLCHLFLSRHFMLNKKKPAHGVHQFTIFSEVHEGWRKKVKFVCEASTSFKTLPQL